VATPVIEIIQPEPKHGASVGVDYRIRSQRANRRRRPVANILIEEELVSTAALASRLSATESVARSILTAVQSQAGCVTWDQLVAERDRRALRRR
jgi:hypothetical protein